MLHKSNLVRLIALLAILVSLLGTAVVPAYAQSDDQVQNLNDLCKAEEGQTLYTVVPANLTYAETAPDGCSAEAGWFFQAGGKETLTNGSYEDLVEVADGIAGTIFYTGQNDAAAPAPRNGDAETPQAEGGWVKIEVEDLPEPVGYPGLVEDYLVFQQSDGLPRFVEITVLPGTMFIMDGDHAVVPGIGEVGKLPEGKDGKGGCYLLVARGDSGLEYVTQPQQGENPPVEWTGRSSWELHRVTAAADAMTWAAEKALALQKNYPATCGVEMDVYVFDGQALSEASRDGGSSVTYDLSKLSPGAYQDEKPEAPAATPMPIEAPAPAIQDSEYVEETTFAGLCAGGDKHYLVLDGTEVLPPTAPCDGSWWFQSDGKDLVSQAPWTEFRSSATGKPGTVWFIATEPVGPAGDPTGDGEGDEGDELTEVSSFRALCRNGEGHYLIVNGDTDIPSEEPCSGEWFLQVEGEDVVDGEDWKSFAAAMSELDTDEEGTAWFLPVEADEGNEDLIMGLTLGQLTLRCVVGFVFILALAVAIGVAIWVIRKIAKAGNEPRPVAPPAHVHDGLD